MTAAPVLCADAGGPPADPCWMFRPSPPAFVLLGRTGDCIIMLPALLEIFRRTGLRPEVYVSHDYADVFEGVSYAGTHPLRCHWWRGVEDAKRVAAARHADVIVPQFWHLPPEHDDTIGWRGAGWTTLQSHGHNHGVDLALDPDFMTSMYRRAGFSPGELRELPLVFDRRSPHREAELLRKVRGDVKKPLLLYNFTGVSSPFPATPEVINPILHRLAGRFHFVNLGLVRAHRIFDLLGIYDVAAGLLTSDTSTLHLAHASPLPYVAFTQNGWTGAIPRGNCALEIKYSDARANAREVLAWASSL